MEKDSNISTIDFTREAFLYPVNLVSLLVATIVALVMSGTGMVSNSILSMAFGAELLYLGIVPNLSSYRQSVIRKKRREKNEVNGDKTLFHQLDVRSQKRFLVLKHIASEVKSNFSKLPYSSRSMLEHIEKKLDDLLSTYLTLLDMNRRYQIYMNSEVEEQLKNEVASQEDQISKTESEQLKVTKKRRVKILRKRLNKFDVAKEKYLICETHLETIEDATRFIYEQSMTMPNAEDVDSKLDHLLVEMEEATTIIEELDDSLLPGFEELDQELELAELRKEAETLNKKTEQKVNK